MSAGALINVAVDGSGSGSAERLANAEFLMIPLENASPQQCHDCMYKDDTLTLTHVGNQQTLSSSFGRGSFSNIS